MTPEATAVASSTGSVASDLPESVSVLGPFVELGLFSQADVHLCAAVVRLEPETHPDVILALAVAARGVRFGHTCVVLADVASTVVPTLDTVDGDDSEMSIQLAWPDPLRWSEALRDAGAVVADPHNVRAVPLRPLVFDGTRVYLQRYWVHESVVADQLIDRVGRGREQVDDALRTAVDSAFGAPPQDGSVDSVDHQRAAVEMALTSMVSIIAGGPGTGKTYTIGRLLQAAVAFWSGPEPLRIALAAPTGKAANRMTAAVSAVSLEEGTLALPTAVTIHRLLGSRRGVDFFHNAGRPLDADLVVIDETSMVDVALMARLLDAVGPDTRLVLVGDPYQLTSIEAGTVLGDLVAAAETPGSPLHDHLCVLTRVHRHSKDSAIGELGDAIRVGDHEEVVRSLTSDDPSVSWILDSDTAALSALEARLSEEGVSMVGAARAGDGAAAIDASQSIKVLAATRHGPLGMYAWSDRIERAVDRAVAAGGEGLRRGERWYVGRPVMITANDPITQVANGDVGVVVAAFPTSKQLVDPIDRTADRAVLQRSVALHLKAELTYMATARLADVETWWAMTIHKSQGSEFPEVVVSLPQADSPILTRELLYTAVTRAKDRVTVVGSRDSIMGAIGRPVSRASGLQQRLAPTEP